MVMVGIDSNYTLVQPMKYRTEGEMIKAYHALLKLGKQTDFEMKKHILDNEYSKALRQLIRDTCKLELVPPGCHWRDVAEVSIKALLPEDLPRSLWDRLLP